MGEIDFAETGGIKVKVWFGLSEKKKSFDVGFNSWAYGLAYS